MNPALSSSPVIYRRANKTMKSLTKTVLSLFFLIALSACNSKIFDKTPIPEDFKLVYQTGGCRTCAGYSVSIDADGNVDYKGKAFVVVEGTQTTIINQEKLSEIFDLIESANFFSLQENYEPDYTILDVGGYSFELTMNGQTKTIHLSSASCSEKMSSHIPQPLCDLNMLIDETVNVDQWVKGP